MCYSPITIVNPTKYVSLKYRDRYLLRVPCGKCAQCQDNKKNEYYLRAFYHASDCLSSGVNNFVLFDTLTYSNKYLPHISDFFDTRYNFPCFNSQHIRLFIARLRQRVKRVYHSNFDFMLSSEYGTSDFHQHRPHYHILFFVRGSVKPLDFSALVAECWIYGRTDGCPYKSNYYVMNNVLNDSASRIRTLKYVTKYISKSCLFSKIIDKRVNAMMFEMADFRAKHGLDSDDWLNSLLGQQFREKVIRCVGQFHRQSTNFGASLLRDLDLNDVFSSGSLKVYDNEKVILRISLPTYYKRKLFYDRIEIDGAVVWSPNDLGLQYLSRQNERLLEKMKLRFAASSLQANIDTDVNDLADYVVNYRGRIRADLPESTIMQRITDIDYYKYATRYDRFNLGKLGLLRDWLGNSSSGYNVLSMPYRNYTLFSFGKAFTYFDPEKEKILDLFNSIYSKIDGNKQKVYEIKQHLVNLYHYLNL